MTAKIRHGKKHRHTHGADPGSPHERLNAMHAMPGRPEGAPMGAMGAPPPSPVPSAPPSMGGGMPSPPDGAMPTAPPGAGPQEGDQS